MELQCGREGLVSQVSCAFLQQIEVKFKQVMKKNMSLEDAFADIFEV